MLRLNRKSLKEYRNDWEKAGVSLYTFDADKVLDNTQKKPQWIHFGSGNIFRAFIAAAQQELLNKGLAETGIVAVETYDDEVVEKVYRKFDNLSVAVTMHGDGRFEKEVIGSVTEALVCHEDYQADWNRLVDIFTNPSLQLASFTITEKGYKLTDFNGNFFTNVADDLAKGPEATTSFMGCLATLTYRRFKAGAYPMAFVSMDNCSHNGDKIRDVIFTFTDHWVKNGLVEKEFAAYVKDENKISYPWSMIDKITPRSSASVQKYLADAGIGDTELITTSRGTYATFVNAEKAQYLVIEDKFPNGRPTLEEVGIIFTDRETVDKAEQMKVCTCLNPLHTALAVYGCLLGYTLIADELKDEDLKKLIEGIGYKEGLPVVVDPKVLNPKDFIKEVLEERFPNPNLPDTPQRIASDTSQKVSIRYGRTISSYGKDAENLEYIPLAIAGWLRYLLAVDDKGNQFELSPDPLLEDLQKAMVGIEIGNVDSVGDKLIPILSNSEIFGCDLCKANLGKKIEGYFKELIEGPGSVRKVLHKYVSVL